MHRMGLRENVSCICGAIQTPQDVMNCCMMIRIRGDLTTIFLNCSEDEVEQFKMSSKKVNQSKKVLKKENTQLCKTLHQSMKYV